MQIAAMNPAYLDKSDVDQATLDKEKEILLIQAKEDPKNANKPENIIEKMVMGRIGKYYEERSTSPRWPSSWAARSPSRRSPASRPARASRRPRRISLPKWPA